MSQLPFFDTNLLIYSASVEASKSAVARRLLDMGGVVSVQVINESVNVLNKKMKQRSLDDNWEHRLISQRCKEGRSKRFGSGKNRTVIVNIVGGLALSTHHQCLILPHISINHASFKAVLFSPLPKNQRQLIYDQNHN